jgi:hypothetical protein
MTVYVIGRSIDEGETIHAYLGETGYNWVESGAVAKWFDTAEEAAEYVEQHQWVCEHTYIKPYEPVETLVNPSEADRTAMVQDALKGMLAKRS